MGKMPEFCMIFAPKILFSGILRAIQGSKKSKAESEWTRGSDSFKQFLKTILFSLY